MKSLKTLLQESVVQESVFSNVADALKKFADKFVNAPLYTIGVYAWTNGSGIDFKDTIYDNNPTMANVYDDLKKYIESKYSNVIINSYLKEDGKSGNSIRSYYEYELSEDTGDKAMGIIYHDLNDYFNKLIKKYRLDNVTYGNHKMRRPNSYMNYIDNCFALNPNDSHEFKKQMDRDGEHGYFSVGVEVGSKKPL